jgi:hypothetical protein
MRRGPHRRHRVNCSSIVAFVFVAALVDGEWSVSRPGRFTPGEGAPGTHLIGVWLDLRAGLDEMEKRKFLTLPGLEIRPLGRPSRSQSLYRLRYPGTNLSLHIAKNRS